MAIGGGGDAVAMSDEDNCGFFISGKLGEELNHDGAGGGIEVAGGFIGEEDGGAVDEGAGDGGALELAARELVRTMVGAIAQTDSGEEFMGAGFGGGGNATGEEEGKKNVFLDGEGGKEMEELKNEANFEATKGGEFVVVKRVERMTLQIGLAGGRGIEGSENVEEGAFAASAGSSDGDDFGRQDFDGYAAEGIDASVASLIGLMEIASFEHKSRGLRDMRISWEERHKCELQLICITLNMSGFKKPK